MKKYITSSETRIGHVHLTVSNLQRSLNFYQEILGFEVTQKSSGVAFLSAGGYHHTIGLNLWHSSGAQKPAEGQIGLYHFAILYPSRKELAKALKQLVIHNYPIDGVGDHGVSEAIYLKDPDGNGLELYYDRDKKEWPKDKEGKLKMHTHHLNINDLLKEAE